MRVAFHTLGCRLNQFETEGMRSRVRDGAVAVELVDESALADLHVINSCGVTSRAEQKCRQLARSLRRRQPTARIAVVGCYSQLAQQELARRPEVDVVLGNEEKRRLDEYLERSLREDFCEVAPYRRGMEMAEEWIDSFGDLSRATLKVQDGCDMRCTFCTIWRARGPARSRDPRQVVEQAQRLAEAGYEEIVLAGVHLGHYGVDFERPVPLSELVEMLLEAVDPRVRLRLSSIDPGEVDDGLLALMLGEERVCRYLHLPVQSGSDAVLQAMRRPYRVADFEALVDRIAAADPTFGVGVDVIVGFPGETDADFEATVALLERSAAAFYHVFRYSDRPDSAAQRLGGKVGGPVAAERSARLRELGEGKRAELQRRHEGGCYEGIAVSEDPATGHHEFLLDDYCSVWAPASTEPGRERRLLRVGAPVDGRLTGTLLDAGEPAGPVLRQGKALG